MELVQRDQNQTGGGPVSLSTCVPFESIFKVVPVQTVIFLFFYGKSFLLLEIMFFWFNIKFSTKYLFKNHSFLFLLKLTFILKYKEEIKTYIVFPSLQLYICDDNRRANEYDFKKALDLLEYIDEVTSCLFYWTVV